MGWYYSGVSSCDLIEGQRLTPVQALMGPTLAPMIGGLFSQYTAVG